MQKKSIIYGRVSTHRQAEEGISVANQIDGGRSKAAKLPAAVLEIFVDEGASAFSGTRPAFQRALAYCRAQHVDYFIVWNTSRFARNKADASHHKRELRRLGTKVVYVSNDIDTDTDEGWLTEGVHELMDEQFSRTLSKEVTRHMRRNAEEGYFNGGPAPFGYRSVPDGHRRRLQVNEDQVPIVRSIFAQFMSGIGSKTIALWLNNSGARKRGGPWTKNHVQYLLKNYAYAGYVTYNRARPDRSLRPEAEWIRRKSHEPIIAEELFLEAQKLFVERAPRRLGGSPRSRSLFTGLLRCGICNQRMQLETATGRSRTYRYYNCLGALQGAGTHKRRIPADALDQWLMGLVIEQLLTPENIAEAVRLVVASQNKHADSRTTQRSALMAELRNAESRRRRLYEVLELEGKGAPGLAELAPRLKELTEQIDAATLELRRLDVDEGAPIDITPRLMERMGTNIRAVLEANEDPLHTREYLASFIHEVVLNSNSTEIRTDPLGLVGAVHSEGEVVGRSLPLRTAVLAVELPERFRQAA